MAINKKAGEVLEFSHFSEYLCHTDLNGVLRLWDTTSGVVRQEYVSKGHLSSRYHCIAWSPPIYNQILTETPKKKRKKSSTQTKLDLQLVALGTSSGSILLYSVKKGDLHTILSGGHEDGVMDVCWSSHGDRLFSCSKDGMVVCWNVEEASIEKKWKACSDVHSIHLCSSQRHLLTAGRLIQLWHIQSQSLIQTFQGHTTDVLKMLEIPSTSNHVLNGDDDSHKSQGVEGSYILSMASNENKISIRQAPNKDLLASLSLPDQPVHFDLIHSHKQLIRMVVVMQSGSMAYFECHLNGRHRKPIKPKIVTTIRTSEGGKLLAILSARLSQGGSEGGDASSDVVCLLYGDLLKPAFHRISLSELTEEIVRPDPRTSKISIQESVVKIKSSKVDDDVSLLSSVHVGRSDGGEKPCRKRKKSFSQCHDEVTLGDQLALMTKTSNNQSNPPHITTHTEELTHSKDPSSKTSFTTINNLLSSTVPSSGKTDSLAMLLMQGLQSGDKKMLNNVLQKSDYLLIRNTVAKLPPQCIHPLVKELSKRISGHAQSGKSGIRWMKTLLSMQSSYLSTVPDIEELLSPLVEQLEVSLEMMGQLMRLKGKLDCMALQFSMVSAPASNSISQPPLSTVHPIDDSDDDLMAEDVRHLEVSDEDEWEDETETEIKNTEDSKIVKKSTDISDAEESVDETLEAD